MRYRALHSTVKTSGVSDGQKTVLLTLGRLPVALDLARGFEAAGWRVVVAEPFGMHLCRMSAAVHACVQVAAPAHDSRCYLDELHAIVNRFDVDLVVPVSEESTFVAALGPELASSTRLFSAAQEQVLRLHDKYDFIHWAKSLDLPVPATWLAGDDGCLDMTRRQDFIVKPRNACSGLEVRRFAAGTEVPVVEDSVVQECLEGRLLSSFSIALDGAALVTSVYEATVLDGSVGVCFKRVLDAASVETWIERFVRASGHTGFIAFDFIVDATGVARAIECNPRATSGIHFLRDDVLPAAIAADAAPLPENPYRDSDTLAESYSCFTAVLGATGDERRSAWRALRSAKDVTWRRSDPWPFLLMMINTWRILWLSATRRLSFAQAAVQDIQWQTGEEGAP